MKKSWAVVKPLNWPSINWPRRFGGPSLMATLHAQSSWLYSLNCHGLLILGIVLLGIILSLPAGMRVQHQVATACTGIALGLLIFP